MAERARSRPRRRGPARGRASRAPPLPAANAAAARRALAGAGASAAREPLGPLGAGARRDPRDRGRAVPRARRRARLHRSACSCSAPSACTSSTRCTSARIPCGSPASSRSPGCSLRRAVRRPVPGAARRRAGAAAAVRADADLAAPERRRHGADAARDLLDRLRLRARGAAARPAARRSDRDRRARRDLPRRHRRLPRRAHVRQTPAGAVDLAEQDRRGPC